MSHRLYGIQCAAGPRCPALEIQMLPLHWGLAVSVSRVSFAFQLGPVAFRIVWAIGSNFTTAGSFKEWL